MSAVASNGDQFSHWLKTKLRQLNTDESVYSSYIIGILESDENDEEKLDALEGILSAFMETDSNATITEILNKWAEDHPAAIDEPAINSTEDMDKKLAKLLESQVILTTVQRNHTPEELRIREQILAQYAQQELEEEDEDGASVVVSDKKVGGGGDNSDLVKNTNAADVQQLLREKREQARTESKEKKDKDKADREKQRAAREEKKEKRKTVKGERRR